MVSNKYNNRLKSICWDITSKCNDNCKFCYRNPNNQELSLTDNKIIIKKLIDFGVDKISFVGGEPLLYDAIFELIKYAREYCNGKTIFSITTNAILLTKITQGKVVVNEYMFRQIADSFEWITFSLDAPNALLQNKIGRNRFHFDRVIALLSFAKQHNLSNKIKINTVVCKYNKDILEQLLSILVTYNIKRWKLFRFLPSRGNAAQHRDEYYITESEFKSVVDRLLELNSKNTLHISVNGYDNFDNSYITISSAGKLVVYDGNQYFDEMDLKEDEMSNILEFINIDKHLLNRSDFLNV